MSSEELLNKLPNSDLKAKYSAADYAEGKVDDKRLNEAVLTPQEERYSAGKPGCGKTFLPLLQ